MPKPCNAHLFFVFLNPINNAIRSMGKRSPIKKPWWVLCAIALHQGLS
ncbi:MAG: hypothetical protein V7K47_10760 [Nostoc sp.]